MPAIERNSGAYSFNDSQFYDKEHHNLQDPADLLVTKLAELRSASDTDLYNAIESLQSVRRTQSQRQPSSPQLGLAHQQHNTFPTGRYPQHNLPSHVSLEIHQLRIQNAYLAHHNRIITREISQAKCTSHALRTVCLQKERAISRLQDDLMSALDRTRSLEKTVADLKMEIEHRRPPPMPSRKIKRSSMSSLALDNLTGGWFRNRRRSVDDYVVEGGRRVGVEISTSPRSSDDSTYDAACHYGRHSLDATRDTDRVNNVRKITRKTGDGHRRIFSGSSSSTSASLVSSLESTAEDESLVLDSDQIRRAINSSNINGANELSDRMTESSNHRGFRRRMKAMLKSSSNLNNSKSMLSIFRAGSSSNLKRRSKGDSHESFFNDLNQRRHCQLENSI
ncbi:hypothetical protein BDF19DRAFT_453165 [Syncephalis fuscata]|nr:hypothetical protein BDF19DRAFT_453165 [Syncephalis fuscata]